MIVYVFGNKDLPDDNAAFRAVKKLAMDLKEIQFIEVKPNVDLPFGNGEDVVIMDTVAGVDRTTLIDPSSCLPVPGLTGGSQVGQGATPGFYHLGQRLQDDSATDSGRGQNDVVKKMRIVLPPRNSVHDFDLGFQLKYLKKLGKLGKVTIIGLPQTGEIDYDSIHSILRKLVAQDMQGS